MQQAVTCGKWVRCRTAAVWGAALLATAPCVSAQGAGNCLDFDGSDDCVSLPAFNLNSNTVTIEAWIRPAGAQDHFAGIVFSRTANTVAGLSITDSNELRYHWNGAGWDFSTGLSVADSQWSHVALVITPSAATVYLNGNGVTHTTPLSSEEFDGETRIPNSTRRW